MKKQLMRDYKYRDSRYILATPKKESFLSAFLTGVAALSSFLAACTLFSLI